MAIRKIVPALVLLSVLSACQYAGMYSSGGSGFMGSGYTGGSTAGVAISGYAFSPSSVAFPGSNGVTVTWTNHDGVAHTVTDGSLAFDSGSIAPGASFQFTFPSTVMTYSYHCSIHPTMTGSIVVQ